MSIWKGGKKMFGLIYSFFCAIGAGASRIGSEVIAERERQDAKRHNYITYLDANNKERLVSNGHRAQYTKVHGDKVVKDLKTGKIVRNLSQERRDERREEARQQGKTVILKTTSEIRDMIYGYILEHEKFERMKKRFKWIDYVRSLSYQDLETYRYYIEVCVNEVYFYMDVIDGHLIRITDYYNDRDIYKKGVWSVDEIIEIFNQRQDRIIHKYNDNNMIRKAEEFYLQNIGHCFIDENKRVLYDGRNE